MGLVNIKICSLTTSVGEVSSWNDGGPRPLFYYFNHMPCLSIHVSMCACVTPNKLS